MLNLKGPYDVQAAAEQAMQLKAAEISALLDQGTDEATQQALALQNSLEDLQADYKAKNALYNKLVEVNSPDNVAKLFVPASQTPTTPDAEKPAGVMKLAEFHKQSPKERMQFVKAGGKIEG